MMWEYYTWRDYQRRRKSEEKRKKAKKQRLMRFRLSRFEASLRPAGALGKEKWVVPARFMNLDFTPDGVSLFTSTPFALGTLLSMTFSAHQTIYLRGRVVQCERVKFSHSVKSDSDFAFRVKLRFEGTTMAASDSVKDFAQEFFYRYCVTPELDSTF